MPLWENKSLFDRTTDMLGQKKKGYIQFNRARDSITTYFRPDYASELKEHGDGTFFGRNIYEGTGSWAVGTMATGFQGGIVTEDSDWLLHQMRQLELKGIDELDIWLRSVKEYQATVYQRGNFFRVLPPFTKDGVSMGSPVMFIEEDILTERVMFLPQHYKTVFLFYDKFNEPEGIIIEDKWTTKKIFDKFAKTKEKADKIFSTGLRKDIEQGLFDTEHTIIRAVFRSNNPLWDVKGFKKPNKAWIDVYFEENTEEDRKNEPLSTEGYFSRPFVVWDYDKKPWESVSRTPAFYAIYDVLSQQQVHKNYLENTDLKNRPPRKVNKDYRNSIDFSPEGITFVKKSDWENVAANIDLVGDVLLNKDLSDQLGIAVKRWFHTDKFMKFTELTNELKEMPTATQVIKMAAEIATQLSPGISTYTGTLADVDDRVIDIESRAGRGPFSKRDLENVTDIIVSNAKTRVTKIGLTPIFVGPLARAQKVKQELDPILDGLGAAAPLFQLDPDLVDAIRLHPTLDDILTATNFPLKNFVPKDEYDQLKAARVEQRQKEKEQLMLLEAAKAAKGVSSPVDETSVLANVAGAGA